MKTRILALFTRTPLHVGAGSSVGAIDQPIIRERHTGFPIIPGSSIKGVLADLWSSETNACDSGKTTRRRDADVTWLFGSDDASDGNASAGALLISEARLLAFPIRSARGSFAWIASPLLLCRAAREGIPGFDALPSTSLRSALRDSEALFADDAPIALRASPGHSDASVVLEDYTFSRAGDLPEGAASALKSLLPDEPVLSDLHRRLAIVSDGMMSHFAQTACEIAQHVRINDATGTAEDTGLFNQENVPSESLFFATVRATEGRSRAHRGKSPEAALEALSERVRERNNVLQIGADATTGLGYCTASLFDPTAKPVTS